MTAKFSKPIATFMFVRVLPCGDREELLAWVGTPEMTDSFAKCPCGITGIEPESTFIFGDDTMQSIALAIRFLHQRLSSISDSTPIYFKGEETPIPSDALAATFGR
jgi:hypothetical protein